MGDTCPAAAAQAKFSSWVRWPLSRFFRFTHLLLHCSLIHSSLRTGSVSLPSLFCRYHSELGRYLKVDLSPLCLLIVFPKQSRFLRTSQPRRVSLFIPVDTLLHQHVSPERLGFRLPPSFHHLIESCRGQKRCTPVRISSKQCSHSDCRHP